MFKKFKKLKKPFAIIANTIKGKGVSYMENNVEWHHKAPNEEQFKIALNEYNKNKIDFRNVIFNELIK